MASGGRRHRAVPGRVEKARTDSRGLSVALSTGGARVSFMSPEIVRVRIWREDSADEPSWSVVQPKPDAVEFSYSTDDLEWTLESSALTVVINKDPFKIRIQDKAGRCLTEEEDEGGVWWDDSGSWLRRRAGKDDRFYGFGEKAFGLDRRGRKMSMWNTDHPFNKTGSDPLYVSIPFFIGVSSGAAYGMFFDSPWKCHFDMGAAKGKCWTHNVEGGPINYYFIAGPDMKKVVERYAWLTGLSPLPPKWSLGFHQSRWSYKNEQSVRGIASKFRSLDIPCDVIHLDIHYMNGYRVFTWNGKRFPDPAGMSASMLEDGFKLVTIVDPGVKNEPGYDVYEEGVQGDFFCRRADGKYFKGVVWPGETVFPDFIRSDVRKWWAGRVADFVKTNGAAGVWNDMNEPSVNIKPHIKRVSTDDLAHVEHGRRVPHKKVRNIYGLAEAMATRDGQLAARPGKRPFLLTRAGYAGIQRYAAIWTGDNTSSWEHLRLSVPMLCSLGLSGVPFVGADIGGFHGNCSPELFARWIQIGVFYPFCRAHSMLLSRRQEPWSFGPRVEKIAREHIKLRYRLMPYIYGAFYESSTTGMPPMRPLALEFQNDEPCFGLDDQFMFGSSLMVAPAMKPGAESREVYFPPGEWIDFHTGERMPGSRRKTVPAPLDVIPIYIRSGSIIPTTVEMCHIGMKPADPLILNIEHGASASLLYYEDDGETFANESGAFNKIKYTYAEKDGTAIFEAEPVETGMRPDRTRVVVKLRGLPGFPSKILLNGKQVHEGWMESSGAEAPDDGWNFDAETKTLRVGYPEKMKPVRIEIS